MSDTVIILQDESVLVAEGKSGKVPEVTRAKRIPIDGFSDSFEQWKEAIRKYKQRYDFSEAKIVLPATYSSSRVMQIPYAKGKQLTRMAEHVMKESRSEELTDYAVIKADKSQGICLCCGGAEEEVLRKLAGIGEELQFSIKEVTVPMEGYLNILLRQPEIQGQTAIVLLFEEGSVTSILFRDGQYLYSTRSRLFSERGTLDFGTEIVRNVSGILQFYATTKSEHPIKEVYYAGCNPDDFIVSEDGLREMNLEVTPLDVRVAFAGREDCGEWLAGIGAFITEKRKTINLQCMWKTQAGQDRTERKNVSIWKHLQFPALTFALCLVGVAGVTVWNHATSSQINKLNAWIQDTQIQQAYQEANELKLESEKLAVSQSQVEQMKANLATYPDLDAKMIETIVDVGGVDMKVRIKSMDAQSGLLTFDAVSEKVIDIPGYVEKLDNTGLFSSIQYSGYSYSEEEYSLVLSCVLKGVETGGEE